MHQNLGYDALLATSERVAFRLDDVIAPGASLDFSRPFLPDALARVRELDFLTVEEQLCLNHIRAHSYLCTFGLVEEFIVPFVLDHVRAGLGEDGARTRALLQFAAEETKHVALFQRFKDTFTRGFGMRCETVGPARAVADSVLAHAPLGVALAILHIEWMTQWHYLEAVKSDEALDPLFRSLLKHHFVEECQHAQLDTLMALELAGCLGRAEVESGIDAYFEIVGALDGLLATQLALDVKSFERARARALAPEQRERVLESQRSAGRFTYLGSGMRHPRFIETLATLSPRAPARLSAAAAHYA